MQVVRAAEPSDYPELRRLLAQLHPETADGFTPGAVRQGNRTFVAERNGWVVGMLLAVYVDYGIAHEGGGTIEQLVVDVGYRDRGIGRELVTACQDWLASEGIRMAFVATEAGSTVAGFYGRCGFRRCVGPWLVWSRGAESAQSAET